MTALSKSMNSGLSPIETDADVKGCWVATLSKKSLDDPMETTPSEIEFEIYRKEVEVVMTIAWRKIKILILDRAHRIFRDRTKEEFQSQIRKSFVDGIRIDQRVAWNRFKNFISLFQATLSPIVDSVTDGG